MDVNHCKNGSWTSFSTVQVGKTVLMPAECLLLIHGANRTFYNRLSLLAHKMEAAKPRLLLMAICFHNRSLNYSEERWSTNQCY